MLVDFLRTVITTGDLKLFDDNANLWSEAGLSSPYEPDQEVMGWTTGHQALALVNFLRANGLL